MEKEKEGKFRSTSGGLSPQIVYYCKGEENSEWADSTGIAGLSVVPGGGKRGYP